MMKMTEKRNFWRAVFHMPVRLSTKEGDADVRLLDISLRGALIEADTGWQGKPGDACTLTLTLAPDTIITMQAVVMHVEGLHIGLRCKTIDLDGIAHLRRLVELNSGDPEILHRELSHLTHKAWGIGHTN